MRVKALLGVSVLLLPVTTPVLIGQGPAWGVGVAVAGDDTGTDRSRPCLRCRCRNLQLPAGRVPRWVGSRPCLGCRCRNRTVQGVPQPQLSGLRCYGAADGFGAGSGVGVAFDEPHRWEVALMVGRPGAPRAVGTAMARNPVPLLVPCHRVVPSSGGVGSYGYSSELKEKLLAGEGALP